MPVTMPGAANLTSVQVPAKESTPGNPSFDIGPLSKARVRSASNHSMKKVRLIKASGTVYCHFSNRFRAWYIQKINTLHLTLQGVSLFC